MAWLKIYQWEHEAYPEFRQVQICRSDVPKYLKKFARHFKVTEPYLNSRPKRSTGTYYRSSRSISLPATCSLGLVIHEFAHHLADETYQANIMHDKRFKRQLKKVYTFAKRYLV
jgi:hypothetical protein